MASTEPRQSGSFSLARLLSGGLAVIFAAAIATNVLFLQGAHHGGMAARSNGAASGSDAKQGFARVSVTVGDETGGHGSTAVDPLVAQVQTELAAMGLLTGEIDGKPGPLTRDAIVQFQKASGLPADGAVSERLLERMRYYRKVDAAAAYTGSLASSDDRAGTTVADIQRGLAKLGYDPGPADGTMGLKTREAIRQFEADRRLPVTGDIGPGLLAELIALD